MIRLIKKSSSLKIYTISNKIGFFNKILNIVIKLINFILLRHNFRLLSILKDYISSFKAKLIFAVMIKDWAVYWIGKYISENLNKFGLIDSVVVIPRCVRNKIIHWGAIDYFIHYSQLSDLNKLNDNIHIISIYHLLNNDKRLRLIQALNKKISLIITPSLITKKVLIEAGFKKEKIVIIPLGVDLSIFKRYSDLKRTLLKKKINLPSDQIIIGSFQKDGVGWGKGLEPKLVKGPDIFCEVVRKLNEKFNIHIFLTGPARGYVKKKLEEYQIPYTHIFLNNYLDIVECYNVLDLYIISSRIEGGPLALPEAMATGVPIVSTNVGMASYFIQNAINGFITEIEDVEQLYKYSVTLLENKELREKFIANGLKTVKKYSWEKIAKLYYYNGYRKFLF